MNETSELLKEIKGVLYSIKINGENDKTDRVSEAIDNDIRTNQKDAINSIQQSFNRLHDKLFSFNNLMIAAFIAFSQYPAENPIFRTWYVSVPTLNMIYLILIEKWEMEKFRHESRQASWHQEERDEHKILIRNQNLRSFSTIVYTVLIFVFLCLSIFYH
ncbi:hypothetical protein [Marinifilum fragile]|uniref:hypothetical protein n=1 Tax=Marinifilum fragile TaxID=570161 RepID=UPI002AA73684|nr:hypothetical protein [Marinifilum fragile]